MKKFLLSIMIVLFLATPVLAEFSAEENDQITILHQAGEEFSVAVDTALAGWDTDQASPMPFDIYRVGKIKSDLVDSNIRLLGSATGNVVGFPLYPNNNQLTGDRATDVENAWIYVDEVIKEINRISNNMNNVRNGNIAESYADQLTLSQSQLAEVILMLESIDRSLSFSEPYLDIFPLQFGPHGDFLSAQKSLGESRRLLFYSGIQLHFALTRTNTNHTENVVDYSDCVQRLFTKLSWIANLSNNVPVDNEASAVLNATGEGLERASVLVALKQIEVANRDMPRDYDCAIGKLTGMMVDEEDKEARKLIGSSISFLTRGWLNGPDGWNNNFMQIVHPFPTGE